GSTRRPPAASCMKDGGCLECSQAPNSTNMDGPNRTGRRAAGGARSARLRRAAGGPVVVLPLEPGAARPLYRQVYDGLREASLAGAAAVAAAAGGGAGWGVQHGGAGVRAGAAGGPRGGGAGRRDAGPGGVAGCAAAGAVGGGGGGAAGGAERRRRSRGRSR